MGIEVGGIFGFLLLILDVWAIVRTLDSRASTRRLWVTRWASDDDAADAIARKAPKGVIVG